MLKPRMNNPCPKDYNAMSPAENGRFCGQCCKVVVDFTKKTAEEIFEYLKNNSGTCGRFLHSQLQPVRVPVEPARKFSARFRRFSTALYFVFGALLFSQTACGGEIDYEHRLADSTHMADTMAAARAAVTSDSIAMADSISKADSVAKNGGKP
jgi:hypothetical protein